MALKSKSKRGNSRKPARRGSPPPPLARRPFSGPIPGGANWRKYFSPATLAKFKKAGPKKRAEIARAITRSEAGKKAAATRRRNAEIRAAAKAKAAQTRQRKKSEARVKAGPIQWDLRLAGESGVASNRDRAFAEKPIPGDYTAIDAAKVADEAERLLRALARKYPTAELWSGGFRYRISTGNTSDGRPIWEPGDFYYQRSFRKTVDAAVREIRGATERFASGERLRDKQQHYYRFWIVAVVAFAFSERGGFDYDAAMARVERRRDGRGRTITKVSEAQRVLNDARTRKTRTPRHKN